MQCSLRQELSSAAISFYAVTEKPMPPAKDRPQLPESWPCKAMQRALMNIELAVSKLAFQKNGMSKKFVGMQAHHVANGNAVCVKPELLVRRLDS